MHLTTRWNRVIGGLLAVLMAAGALATPAQAKHGRYRYKGGYDTRVVYRPAAPVYYYRSSHQSVLPYFVGGLILGAAITHATAAHADYVYEDPYCHRAYASYDSYLGGHGRYCDHPRVVRVIEVRSRRCVDVRRYDGGRWVEYGGGYGDRDRDGCRDRDYAYDRGDDRYERGYSDRTRERDRGDYYGRDDDRDWGDDDQGEWRR